jgi:hypothetical protein
MPRLTDGYPLPTLGWLPTYSLADTRYQTERDLDELFATSGAYALADTRNKREVVTSFAKYATREYNRQSVTAMLAQALTLTAAVTPRVQATKLTPYETIGQVKGTKASGYLCNGTKGKFHSLFLNEMQEALVDPTSLMECVPIFVLISKDEVRLTKKECRDLGFPPVWFSNLAMMHEKDFFLVTLESFMKSPIKLGIPLPQAWPHIIQELRRFMPSSDSFQSSYHDWDASQFDRSHPIEVTLSWHNFMLIKECLWIQTDSQVAAYLSFWSCFRIFYLPDGRVVLVSAGIYSGDVSTSNKNSYFHIVRLALCWISIFKTTGGFRTFMFKSGICIFGDDAVCAAHDPMALRFLTELSSTWYTLFGSELVMHKSTDISGVSFLGKRSLGNDSWQSVVPVTADLDRQISSLVLKGKRSMTVVQRLSKLVAHRLLLCGFDFESGPVSVETNVQNQLGRQHLAILDAYLQDYVKKYEKLNAENPDWRKLVYYALCPPQSLFAFQMKGTDVLLTEGSHP